MIPGFNALVVICFQISIFEPLETTRNHFAPQVLQLWFAFKLVSLNHWKQLESQLARLDAVVICFQISIFEPLETTSVGLQPHEEKLWFAFKLVSLNHWKQLMASGNFAKEVVICFQISIFEPLETTFVLCKPPRKKLWFAFKLVSLNHWKQHMATKKKQITVVICFQISIFEPLETTRRTRLHLSMVLWFAFKLVSLNHWKQLSREILSRTRGCDLLSN